MELFLSYIKYRKRIIFLYVLFFIIFFVVFALYRFPAAAVIYPFVICLIITAVVVIYDFVCVRQRYKKLEELKKFSEAVMEDFPKIRSLEEAQYIEMISVLKDKLNEQEYVFEKKYNDVVEYYTLWVHQIKTPIASMRLTLQNEDSELSRRISGDLFRIEQYVEMVLTYLRLDSESSDYVFKEYDIDGILRKCIKKFASEFIARHLSIDFIPAGKVTITDEKWISFVIEQIISNALKYTRKGGIKIYTESPDILCIEDSGIGIAPEDLPRIFEKGYTGNIGRSEKHSSGIGLYLCRRICDNLGIKITVQSEMNKGTKVMLDMGIRKIVT